ncbi:RDD family protein [Mycoplasmopsis pullorum]|uniref:RDD family protein n=1 Tax=Mycoplasmopsis pullorum TaxID=48003 RepID=UPI0011198523|nr:RDD family protein [Mycoplasmopsis pullorum]TNK83569.1 hypothetical protein C4M93_02075 [Mycoplasmopsis pullorum]
MIKYKNANFWIRFASNLIDFFATTLFISLVVFLLSYKEQKFSSLAFYSLPFLINVYILIYWLYIPWVLKTKTLGQWICQIKTLNQKNEALKFKELFKRAILWITLPILVFFGMILFFNDESIQKLNNNAFLRPKNINDLDLSNFEKIGWACISSVSSIWVLMTILNYLFILFSKKRLALIDIISNTRVVWKKPILVTQEQIILKPMLLQKRQIIHVLSDKAERNDN